MRRWQRIRVFVLQGVNVVFGIALIWIGIAAGIWGVALVGGLLLAFAAVLLVVALRMGVSDSPPPGRSDRR